MLSEQIIFALKQKIAAGETVYAISKATGVAQGIIGRFIRGEREVRSSTLDILAAYLNLQLVELPSTAAGKPTATKPPATKPRKTAAAARGGKTAGRSTTARQRRTRRQ